MSSGPEHYRRAEEIMESSLTEFIESVRQNPDLIGSGTQAALATSIAAAQVHATLALAAATVLAEFEQPSMGGKTVEAWREVLT